MQKVLYWILAIVVVAFLVYLKIPLLKSEEDRRERKSNLKTIFSKDE